MVSRQSKRPLTFPPRPLGDMFCKSEGLIQSGTHILSYCDDSFPIKLCPPIGPARRWDWSRIARFHSVLTWMISEEQYELSDAGGRMKPASVLFLEFAILLFIP